MSSNLSEKLYVSIFLTLLVVCSCGNNNQKKTENYEWEGNNIEELHIPDSMVRVRLDSFDSDSFYVTIKSTQEMNAFGYLLALNDNSIKGTIHQGDEYSVLVDAGNNHIKSPINVTEIMGQWYYDMQQHRGLVFGPQGSLSSINTDEISFRRWQILNGKLLIYYVYMQQIAEKQNQFEVDAADIQELSSNEFCFTFRNKQYNCRRMNETIKFHSAS